MVESEAQRDFNLSDAELAQFVGDLCNFITRDISEFGGYSILAADVTALVALGNAFEVFPKDDVYRADISIAVEDKDAARDELLLAVRNVSNRAMNKWGENSARYRKFGVINLNRSSDKELVYTSRSVHTVGTEYLAELASEGLTQLMLDDLAAKSETFETALHTVKTKTAVRDEKTEERITKGNELYAFVVKYCNIGKQIWEAVSEAKYNDYVIYPSTTQMPGKVQNMGYDMPTRTVSWDTAPHAEDYQLERKFHSDPDWTVVYEGADTSVVNDPVTPGMWYFRCRGQNANGYGEWSDELEVIMPT
ncbi:MAG: hypothetical protein ACTSO2_19790 [Promethearchaeota archaeon]